MRPALFLLALLTACSGYDDLALLDVERIEPPELEPGAILRIRGDGFPLGREAQIRLRGSVYRPGKSGSSIDARLRGEVRSESLIEIPVGEQLIDALGGRATVDGELRVGFVAADRQRDVFSAERVRLDFLPDTSAQLRASNLLNEPDDSMGAQSFGIDLSREELGTVGVRVEAVAPGSLADIQGVKPGDAIVGLDGMSLYSWRDFHPDPSRSQSTVHVTREGLRGVHAIRWPHEATERRAAPAAIGLFVVLGLLLGWLSPAALAVRGRVPQSSGRASLRLTRASLILGFAALLSFVSALQWTTMWILGLGTFAALFTLATRSRSGTVGFAFAVASTLTVMLLSGSASIAAIVVAQSPAVLHWYVFQSPASFFAMAAFLHATRVVAMRPNLSASLYTAAAAVLGAAIFLGGWPEAHPIPALAALVGKSGGIVVAAKSIELSPRTALACAVLGVALALVALVVDIGTLFPEWSALAVGGVCALAVRALVPPLRRESAPVAI